MKILFKSFHIIDVEDSICIEKEIPEDFDSFIQDYYDFACNNDKNKEYQIIREDSDVVHCISQMGMLEDRRKECSKQIAEHLLECEKLAQSKIFQTGTNVKKGSLVQALIDKEDGTMQYLLAKVEHSKWYDGNDLSINYGFAGDKNNIWKSAVFKFYEVNGQILFDRIQVFNDTKSKYWYLSFLQVEEVRDDFSNTLKAYQAIDTELKSTVKSVSPRDYVVLSTEVQNTMNQSQPMDYDSYIEDLMDNYQPTNEEIQKDVIKECLLNLPQRKKFDTEFVTVPQSIQNKRTKKFKIAEGVELTIRSDAKEFGSRIISTMSDGKRILQIYCDDNETYEAFIEE